MYPQCILVDYGSLKLSHNILLFRIPFVETADTKQIFLTFLYKSSLDDIVKMNISLMWQIPVNAAKY